MNGEPRVSVVVPCYNYGQFVAQAVDSVLDQTYQRLEVIVIDDASTDDSGQALEAYADESRVRIVRHPKNRGHIRTYNEGIGMARGELIGLLSADDFLASRDAIARQVELFDRYPRVGFVYSACQFVDTAGQASWVLRPWEADYVRDGLEELTRLIFDNYIPASGTLVRRRCHAELGQYDPSLPHTGDWDLWLRIATRFQVGYIADPLVAYRVHHANMSHAAVGPAQANSEVIRTITKAFAALPATVPAEIRRLLPAALRRGWLRTPMLDRDQGRIRRAWQGLFDAARRSPGLLATPELYGALARLAILTAIGHRRYVMLAKWRAARRARYSVAGL